jgi:TM2 domain-containing membrane protein YozV
MCEDAMEHRPEYHSVGIAAVVSMIFPGGGQFYNSQPIKGILFMLAAAIEIGIIVAHTYLVVPVLSVGLLIWVISILDSGVIAGRKVRNEHVGQFKWF